MATKDKQQEKVTFISRYRDHQVCMEKSQPIIQHGVMVGRTEPPPITFVNGRYTTDDPQEIDYLRSRPGLTEVDAQAFAPDPSELLAEVAIAGPDELKELWRAETDSHQRELVLETIEKKLSQYGETPED